MKMPMKKLAEHIFDNFCDGYKKRDLKALLNLFTSNTIMWGSGIDEYRVGLKEIEKQLTRDWSQSDKGEIEVKSFVATPEDALWTAAVCNAKVVIHGKEYIFEHLRGTIIIGKENDAWKISHMHASFPDFKNAENNSFPNVS